MIWEKIQTVNITTADGESDTIHFESNKEGGFRLRNDYGNECLTFDIMTGLEAFTKIQESIQSYINSEIQNDFRNQNIKNPDNYADTDSSIEDCQGDLDA